MLDAVVGTLEMQGLWPLPPSLIRIVSVGSLCFLIQSLGLVSDWGGQEESASLVPTLSYKGGWEMLVFSTSFVVVGLCLIVITTKRVLF